MNYIAEILWLLSWPLMILVSYWIISWVLKRFDQKEKETAR
jgi:hypothetical protein